MDLREAASGAAEQKLHEAIEDQALSACGKPLKSRQEIDVDDGDSGLDARQANLDKLKALRARELQQPPRKGRFTRYWLTIPDDRLADDT